MAGPILAVRDLVKCYGDVTAVSGLSFQVSEGEIFGLLGPNGAGKTTTIRIIMDIFGADGGAVHVLGRSPGEARAQVGYLPEERGLYPRLRVLEVLSYLAQLKGVPAGESASKAKMWLERVELGEWGNHHIQDLSRGMQQKIQFIASVVHGPRLAILDEPFQGLDPVNVDLMMRLIKALRDEGTTVVLSAHEMNLVEALCDRIVLINGGKAVLYGRLEDIRHTYAMNTVRLRTPSPLDAMPAGVTRMEHRNGDYMLTLNGVDPQTVLTELVGRGVRLESFEVGRAPLEEIFIRVVTEAAHA
ncbi:MAG: ABC transporter ATP-binding protein [Anaerolineae bacterium]